MKIRILFVAASLLTVAACSSDTLPDPACPDTQVRTDCAVPNSVGLQGPGYDDGTQPPNP
jgi:hypothetical protein